MEEELGQIIWDKITANLHRLFNGELKTVTISKTKTNKYYASLLFDNRFPDLESAVHRHKTTVPALTEFRGSSS